MIASTTQIQQATPSSEHRKRTVISHRGLCSIFPENTIESLIAGLHVSDLTELDVHLTKDDELIVTHDRYLSRNTNICEFLEFSDRFKQEIIDDYQEIKNDWWIRDFTLAELRKLTVFQPVSYRPQLPIPYKLNTLEEVIIQALKVANNPVHKNKLKSGILIELKQEIAASLTERDKVLCQKVLALLKKYNLDTLEGCKQNNLGIVIQSFCVQLFPYLEDCENWQVQLYDSDIHITEEMLLRNRTKRIKGIGVTQKNLLDENGNASKRVDQLCEKLDYALYYWTIRDDDMINIPFGCPTYSDVYLKLCELGVTGFITEFPDKCKGVLKIATTMYQKGNSETENNHKERKPSESNSDSSSSSEDSEGKNKKSI